MTTRYLPVGELQQYMRSEIGTEDNLYEDAIKTAEDIIDESTGRQFIVASTSTARSFDVPNCSSRLQIHDCTAVASVVDFGATLTVDTQYKLYPLGGVSATGRAVPYSEIVRLGANQEIEWLDYGRPGQIVVTATWGWLAIPSLVKSACKVIAKDVFLTRDTTGFGIVAITEAGGVGTRENWVVRRMLDAFPHPNSIGLA